MEMARRLESDGRGGKYVGLTRRSGGRTVCGTASVSEDESASAIPHRLAESRNIFVNSMSDLFHERVSDGFILKVWQVMRETPRHHYQILTSGPNGWHRSSRRSSMTCCQQY